LRFRRQDVAATRDLLKQIEGVDGLVTRGVKVRWLGRLGGTLSTFLFAYVAKSGWSWLLFAPVGGIAVSAAVVTQGRHWIREAKRPFRYTYSVDPFEPISVPQDPRLEWAVDWIRADLILMLSERIGRLALLPQDQISPDTPEEPASHIHISGAYGSRYKGNGDVTVELMPRVRIGSECCSSKVALAVRFDSAVLPDLKRDRQIYDHILERVYFSVATQIYRQLRGDVDRKIALLPTSYLRATAYFHEAVDYARSNTLDAFNDAGELYGNALDLYDKTRLDLPKNGWQRPLRSARRYLIPKWRRVARKLAFFWPRFGQRDVQIARAKTGYAKALLFRNILANLSGREQKRVFDARRYARDALEGLQKVQDGVEGRVEAFFEAHVVAALAEHWSGDMQAAETELKEVRRIRGSDADGTPLLPFVEGAVEPRLPRKVRLLRRAVELDPRFEIAQFELAFNQEQLWRSNDELEKTGSRLVEAEYNAVVTRSPANLTAWANLGYVRWLLWDAKRQDARDVVGPFEAGRRYKEIREEAFVAELDYGLARVAAEQGDIEKAYEHYVSASGATMEQDATRGYVNYSFDRINAWILHRYERYLATVRRSLANEATKADRLPRRICDAVEAFALTDWGNACASYYRRSGDTKYRNEAFRAFGEALKRNPRYVLALQSRAAFNLWLDQEDTTSGADLDRAEQDVTAVLEHEPRWLPGLLENGKTWLALTTHAEDQRAADVEKARAAFNRLVDGLPSTLPRETLDAEALAQIEQSKRRNEELLTLVTGPIAEALALYVRLQSVAEIAEAGVEYLCRYVQTHLRPGDLDLLTRLRDAADDAAKKLLRRIVETKVENDPANRYWLNKLFAMDETEIPKKTRVELLHNAARWPGASWQTLERVADELEKLKPKDEAIKPARRRAATQRDELERGALEHLADLVEEHLEDGHFDDERLTARLAGRVDKETAATEELLADVRGRAFPTVYLCAARGEKKKPREILDAVADNADDRCAEVALRALVHFTPREPSQESAERIHKIVAKRPLIAQPLVHWLDEHDRSELARLLEDIHPVRSVRARAGRSRR
jgi:hypothetical protein